LIYLRADLRGGYDCERWQRPVSDDATTGTSFRSGSRLENADREPDAFLKLESNGAGSPRFDGWTLVASNVASVILTVGNAHLKELSILNSTMPSASNNIGQTSGVAIAGGLGDPPLIEHCSLTVNQASVEYPGVKTAVGIGVLNGSGVLRRNVVIVRDVRGICHGLLFAEASPVTSTDSDVVSAGNSISFEGSGTDDGDGGAVAVNGVFAMGKGSFMSDRDRVIGPRTLVPAMLTLGFVGFFEQTPGVLKHVVNASIVLDGNFHRGRWFQCERNSHNARSVHRPPPSASSPVGPSIPFSLVGSAEARTRILAGDDPRAIADSVSDPGEAERALIAEAGAL
jgi:hypothetical protein